MLDICLGQIGGLTPAERTVGILGLFALAGLGGWALIRWVTKGTVRPDPWDDQVARDLAEDDCTPLCHHCLNPHELSANFCPRCGAAVGTYTNWLPYPYLFSIGHALRIGTDEKFKRSPLTIGGFFFFSLVEYSVFAPLYWIRFVSNLTRTVPPDHSSQTPEPPPAN
jgi:hypothetical protein